MARLLILLIVGSFFVSIGCSGGQSYDENYKTEVKQTADQKAKEADLMKGQQQPGQLKR